MGHNEKPRNTTQNMAMDQPFIVSFLTSLPPIDSPEPQLSIGARLVKNEPVQGRFTGVFVFYFFAVIRMLRNICALGSPAFGLESYPDDEFVRGTISGAGTNYDVVPVETVGRIFGDIVDEHHEPKRTGKTRKYRIKTFSFPKDSF